MRRRLALITALALGLSAALAVPVLADGDEDEEEITLEQLRKEAPAAAKTIEEQAKGAEIEEIEKETRKGKVVYEAEFVVRGKEIEIEVAPNGTLLSREVEDDDDDDEAEEEVTIKQVPAAVRATILKVLKEAKGAKIEEIEKETRKGKVVYEAELVVGGKEIEIRVDPAGKLLSREVEDDDDDDDEGEEEVTIKQVPAAVRATILKEAKGAKIEEIEKETRKGKTVYEAEFVVGGKEIEIRVDSTGKLLSREVEDDDDDKDDHPDF